MAVTKGRLLVVDDEQGMRDLMCQMLRGIGYESRTAGSGPEALEMTREYLPDLILMDINMPGMSGYQVCRKFKEDPRMAQVPVIFISGMDDTRDKVEGFTVGGVDYITKPVQLAEVAARIENHLALQNLRRRLQEANDELEQRVEERTIALKHHVDKLQSILESAIYAMAKIVEIRDPYTAGHQLRVAQLSKAIAEQVGLEGERVEGCYMTAVIHDIGKIYVPAEILSKPGQLSELEQGLLHTHAEYGAEIARMIDFPWPVADIIRQHHERLDGSGYPRGLKGNEILLEAKILAVADVVEALSSHRPYRPAWAMKEALEEITGNSDLLYEPQVVEACIHLFSRGRFHFAAA